MNALRTANAITLRTIYLSSAYIRTHQITTTEVVPASLLAATVWAVKSPHRLGRQHILRNSCWSLSVFGIFFEPAQIALQHLDRNCSASLGRYWISHIQNKPHIRKHTHTKTGKLGDEKPLVICSFCCCSSRLTLISPSPSVFAYSFAFYILQLARSLYDSHWNYTKILRLFASSRENYIIFG